MKLTQLAVATAAAFSLSAIAAGDQKQQKQEPQAQSGQSQSSQTQGSQQAAASSQSPELVKQAQEKLSAAGHDAGPADGKLGAKTQAALKEFQQSKGLQASGQLDQKTVAALGVSASGSSTTSASTSDKSASSGATSDKPASSGAPAGKSSGSSAGASSAPAASGSSSSTEKPKY
jgi:peptidoglycan hydrolase-like protein with peptidoglycan-binding domain